MHFITRSKFFLQTFWENLGSIFGRPYQFNGGKIRLGTTITIYKWLNSWLLVFIRKVLEQHAMTYWLLASLLYWIPYHQFRTQSFFGVTSTYMFCILEWSWTEPTIVGVPVRKFLEFRVLEWLKMHFITRSKFFLQTFRENLGSIFGATITGYNNNHIQVT